MCRTTPWGQSDRVTFSSTSPRLTRNGNAAFSSAVFSRVDEGAVGDGGDIHITATTLEVLDGALLSASTFGEGDAGRIQIRGDRVAFGGVGLDGRLSSANSAVGAQAMGQSGDITITATTLALRDGAWLVANTAGQGDAGSVTLSAGERITIDGVSERGFSSAIFTNARDSASGAGGPITIDTPTFFLTNGAVVDARTENSELGGSIRITADVISLIDGGQIITTTLADGQAGSITLDAHQIVLSGRDPTFAARRDAFPDALANEGDGQSGLFTSTREGSTGAGGSLNVNADFLILSNGAIASAQSDGGVTAGTITLNATDTLRLFSSDITSAAFQSSGGDILINAVPDAQGGLVQLSGDSDITTNSLGDGGNITIGGAAILAFDDSDIISRSDEALGGNITLTRFFSEPIPPGSAEEFDGNGQVDLNASGAIASGTITTADTSFLQNSLAALPEGLINTEELIANSCIARNEDGSGTFVITGGEGRPEQPGNTITNYATNPATPSLSPKASTNCLTVSYCLSRACNRYPPKYASSTAGFC